CAAVNVSAVRGDAAQSPMKPGGADFMNAQGSESGDLPVVAQVAFELRLQPRESRTDLVGRLECFGCDRNETLLVAGSNSKQRLVSSLEAGRRQFRFRKTVKGVVVGDID